MTRRDDDLVDGDGAEERAAARAVRSLVDPAALSDDDHEALLAMTLGDDVAELGDDERRAADELRHALEALEGGEACTHPLIALAGSLRATHAAASARPVAIDALDHEALIALTTGEIELDQEQRRPAEALRRALAIGAAHAAEQGELGNLASGLRALAQAAEESEAQAQHDLEALLSLSLQVEPQVSPAERREASALAAALAENGEGELMDLARALTAAAGRDIDELSHQRILKRLAAAPARPVRRWRPIVGAIVAMAAGVALLLAGPLADRLPSAGRDAAQVQAGLAVSFIAPRSTEELFDPGEPFPVKGGESDRIGRMVSARSADVRANRFRAWGVTP
jgi:hypothetical protein